MGGEGEGEEGFVDMGCEEGEVEGEGAGGG